VAEFSNSGDSVVGRVPVHINTRKMKQVGVGAGSKLRGRNTARYKEMSPGERSRAAAGMRNCRAKSVDGGGSDTGETRGTKRQCQAPVQYAGAMRLGSIRICRYRNRRAYGEGGEYGSPRTVKIESERKCWYIACCRGRNVQRYVGSTS